MTRIKVLYVITSLGRGGVQEHIRLLVSRLDPSLFEIWVAYGPPTHHLNNFKAAGAKLVDAGLVKSISPLRDFRSFLILMKTMQTERFDIVHTHMTKAGILGRAAGRLAGTEAVIMTAHGWGGILRNYYSSTFARNLFLAIEKVWGRLFTDCVILLTESDRSDVLSMKVVPDSKIKVIPNGIDLPDRISDSSRLKSRARLGIPPRSKVAITVGRLCRQKAPEVLVGAARRILEKGADAFFILAGDGPRMEPLRRLVSDLSLSGRILLLGARADIPELLSAADVFVLPSIYEGLPLSILEAMAAGLPVVATDISGNRDLVTHEVSGLLVEMGDEQALAKSIFRLFNNPEKAIALGENGRQRISSEFSLDSMVKHTVDAYLDSLAGRR